MPVSVNTYMLDERLVRSERFYYLVSDLYGNILFANSLLLQHTQKKTGIFSSIAARRFCETIRQALENPGSNHPVELEIVLADGKEQCIHWELSVNLNEEGVADAVTAMGVAHAENEKRLNGASPAERNNENDKAYEQISYLARLIDTVSDIIISQDKDFKIISWNRAAEMTYGYASSEMIGREVKDALHFEYQGISRTRFFEIVREVGEWHGEAYVVNRHGRPITVLASIIRIRNAKGETTGFVSVSKDITEKRKMEFKLEESELFYRSLFANSLDGVLITDEKGIIRFASSSITPILGYTSEEVLGKSVFNFTHLEDRPLAISSFMDEMNGDLKAKFISLRLLQKSREWMWCFVRGHNLVQNPYIKGMVIYFHDDTLRRQTEAALIASEQRFRNQAMILNNVTDVIITTDTKGLTTSMNSVLEKLSGLAEVEAIGKPFLEVLPLNMYPFTEEQVGMILARDGIWRGELHFKSTSGETVYLLHTISMLTNDEGTFIGYLGVGKDITERKIAEKRLQQSEQFYRDMSYHSFDGIIMSDPTGRIIYVGPSVQRISGYEPSQLLGRNFFDYVHPEDTPVASKAFSDELDKVPGISYVSLRINLHNQWTWCTVRGHNLLDTPGFNAVVLYFTNDSKRKIAEDKLRKSEENFRNLVFNLKQGVLVQDKDGKIVVCNQAALDMIGADEEQIEGKLPPDPDWYVIHEDGRLFSEQDFPVSTVYRTKRSVRDVIMGIHRPGTNDMVWVLSNAEAILDADGEIINVICSFTDITEQKRLSRELFEQEVQKQRLLTQATIDGQEKERQQMGKELHDNINQHLTTIRLYLEVAKEKANGEVLEMIQLSHNTLADIIFEIRQLSQSLVPPTLGDLGLVDSIQDLCDSLRRTDKLQVDFYSRFFSEEHLPGKLKLMLYRITQEQVNNILRHAKASNLYIRLGSDAEYIMLDITDDGIGFDPVHQKKGMGLGNISTRAGLFNGKVEVKSAPGKGCRLSVLIPLAAVAGEMN